MKVVVCALIALGTAALLSGTNAFQLGKTVTPSVIASQSPLFRSSSSKKTLPLTQEIPSSFLTIMESSSSSSSNDNNNNNKVSNLLPTWDPTNWTPGRFWNNNIFRTTTLLLVLFGAMRFFSSETVSFKLSSRVASTIHILSYATWFGSMVYTTFVAGITMYKNLPRKTFGTLQSKLFPKYFSLCAFTILAQMVTLRNIPSLGQISSSSSSFIGGGGSMITLGISMAMTLLNIFYLEPLSTKTMFARYQLEEVPGGRDSIEYKKLAGTFGFAHGMSSLTNLIALCGAIVHGYFIASALA